jgi:hypothetical protein
MLSASVVGWLVNHPEDCDEAAWRASGLWGYQPFNKPECYRVPARYVLVGMLSGASLGQLTSAYIPAYRTTNGTGCGLVFAACSPRRREMDTR